MNFLKKTNKQNKTKQKKLKTKTRKYRQPSRFPGKNIGNVELQFFVLNCIWCFFLNRCKHLKRFANIQHITTVNISIAAMNSARWIELLNCEKLQQFRVNYCIPHFLTHTSIYLKKMQTT